MFAYRVRTPPIGVLKREGWKVYRSQGVLQKLRIEDELQLARLVRVLLRTFRWPTGFRECADRAFPQSAVPQDPFNDWPLISFDKADNLYLTATLAAF